MVIEDIIKETEPKIELPRDASITAEGIVERIETDGPSNLTGLCTWKIYLAGDSLPFVLSYKFVGDQKENALQLTKKLNQLEGAYVVMGGRFTKTPFTKSPKVNASYIATDDFYVSIDHSMRQRGIITTGNNPGMIIKPLYNK